MSGFKIQINIFLCVIITFISSCKNTPTQPLDFSQYTQTNSECTMIGAMDTTNWTNTVLDLQSDTPLLNFYDGITLNDSFAANITVSPVCPNPSNGFFIWNVASSGPCKLRLVCVDLNLDVLYYNSYLLQGGPLEITFDFRKLTAFQSNTNYRMYYGFYTGTDSIFYSGYGDFRIQ